MDEVSSLEQIRRIRDIIYQCCIDYVNTIEMDKVSTAIICWNNLVALY